jgi:hypothetical protein
LRDLMMASYIANAMDQVSETPDAQAGAVTSAAGYRRREWTATVSADQVPLVTNPPILRP